LEYAPAAKPATTIVRANVRIAIFMGVTSRCPSHKLSVTDTSFVEYSHD
jgi:hypothetical protein